MAPILTYGSELSGPKLTWVHALTWCGFGTQTMEKVWVLAVPITIGKDLRLQVFFPLVLRLPMVSVVTALGVLQFVEQTFVLVYDSGQAFDSVGSIQ